MKGLSFSLACSEADVDRAFQLALSIFEPQSGMSAYESHKIYLWKGDPSYALENFVLARAADESICGLIRIVPRKVFRGEEAFSVAGISSVCLSERYRGNGNSLGLMQYALECCRKRAFDFAFLFARRAADNYYTRFGFHGISSYSRISVNHANFRIDPRFEVRPSSEEHLELYASAYEKCYAEVFGRVERSSSYWQFLLRRFSASTSEKFETLYYAGMPVGYVVGGASVHELAVTHQVNREGLVAFLGQKFTSGSSASNIQLDMSPQHALVGQLAGMDVTLTTRECAFGGHMACILNVESLLERVARIYPGICLGGIGSGKLSHVDTCKVLGAYAVTVKEDAGRKLLPYQMTSPDHF